MDDLAGLDSFFIFKHPKLNNKPMFQVGWPNLRNWKFLGVGTQAHSGHTVAWTYEYKLDRCKRTWIIANAHAYIIGIHMQTCEYRKKTSIIHFAQTVRKPES